MNMDEMAWTWFAGQALMGSIASDTAQSSTTERDVAMAADAADKMLVQWKRRWRDDKETGGWSAEPTGGKDE